MDFWTPPRFLTIYPEIHNFYGRKNHRNEGSCSFFQEKHTDQGEDRILFTRTKIWFPRQRVKSRKLGIVPSNHDPNSSSFTLLSCATSTGAQHCRPVLPTHRLTTNCYEDSSLIFLSLVFWSVSLVFFLRFRRVKNPWCFGWFSLVFTWTPRKGRSM